MLFPAWKKMVVKVGSALIAPDGAGVKTTHMLAIARLISASRKRDRQVILVSSGAVAAGLSSFPELVRKRSIPEKQALAALGQSMLMKAWQGFFDFPCAQVLLTHDDLRNRKRYVNARNTLRTLLDLGALPIVNENDTVAVEELKVGDNDNLAAHVGSLVEADALLILSDVDGLYTANPGTDPSAILIPRVETIDDGVFARAGGSGSRVGTGGMVTKLEAAAKATRAGIDVVIANGRVDGTIDEILAGRCPGTHFVRDGTPMAARKHWLVHAMPVRGRIGIDGGAVAALRDRGASLLPSGVIAVSGDFQRGDAVEIADAGNGVLARGLAQYSAEQLNRIKGLRSASIAEVLGFAFTDVVVHRGDLVLMTPDRAMYC